MSRLRFLFAMAWREGALAAFSKETALAVQCEENQYVAFDEVFCGLGRVLPVLHQSLFYGTRIGTVAFVLRVQRDGVLSLLLRGRFFCDQTA